MSGADVDGESLLVRGLQVIYSIEHADRVKHILTTSRSVCHDCKYNYECGLNELCTDALYAYIFHDLKPLPKCNKKSMPEDEYEKCKAEWKKEQQRRNKLISRAIEKILQISPECLNTRKGKHNEKLWSLRKPVFLVLEDLYFKAAISIDEFWRRGVMRYSLLSNVMFDLSLVIAKYEDMIKEPKISIQPRPQKNGGYKISGTIELKDGSKVELSISLSPLDKDIRPGYTITYSVAWIKEGRLLYVWDNSDNAGKRSAPFHIHIGETITIEGRHKNPQQTWMVPSLVSMFCLIYRAYRDGKDYTVETLKQIYEKHSESCYQEGIRY